MLRDTFDFELILASGSPRRKELLSMLDIPFKVIKPDVDEVFPDHLVKEDVAIYLAKQKADFFKEVKENQIIITADTIVCLEQEILNKPGNREDAIEMLEKLSGNKHDVITAVHIKSHARRFKLSATTSVYFKPLRLEEIEYYVDNFKPYDKAGGYGIQDWIGLIGIEKIEGSYFNVVGLPVFQLYEALRQF